MEFAKELNTMAKWLCQRENITLVIAIAGFVMSLYNFFRAIWDKRCSFSVGYVSHYCHLSRSEKHAELVFRLNFINQSSVPLTIVRMFMVVDDKKYEFLFPEQQVYRMTRTENGKTFQIGEIKSQSLPVRIEGNGALGGYFAVYLPPEMEKRFQLAGTWKIIVQATQKKKTFSIVADNPGYDIEKYGY